MKQILAFIKQNQDTVLPSLAGLFALVAELVIRVGIYGDTMTWLQLNPSLCLWSFGAACAFSFADAAKHEQARKRADQKTVMVNKRRYVALKDVKGILASNSLTNLFLVSTTPFLLVMSIVSAAAGNKVIADAGGSWTLAAGLWLSLGLAMSASSVAMILAVLRKGGTR